MGFFRIQQVLPILLLGVLLGCQGEREGVSRVKLSIGSWGERARGFAPLRSLADDVVAIRLRMEGATTYVEREIARGESEVEVELPFGRWRFLLYALANTSQGAGLYLGQTEVEVDERREEVEIQVGDRPVDGVVVEVEGLALEFPRIFLRLPSTGWLPLPDRYRGGVSRVLVPGAGIWDLRVGVVDLGGEGFQEGILPVTGGGRIALSSVTVPPDLPSLSGVRHRFLPSSVTVEVTGTFPSLVTVRSSRSLWRYLDPGEYTFRASYGGRDEVKEVTLAVSQVTEVIWDFERDFEPPDTTILSGPRDPTSSTSVSFTFACSETGCSFQCQLDSGLWEPCGSPKGYSGLSDGGHNFFVRALDQAGNLDPTPATWSFKVDTLPPETTIQSGPLNPTSSTTADFTFTCSESGCTFECRLDGGAWGSCTSPRSYTGLAEGSHTFEVRARDLAGNLDSTPATWGFVVDTTSPETFLTGGPLPFTNVTVVEFFFTSDDPSAVFECQLNGGGFTPCGSPKQYSGLGDGAYTFEVRAVDLAGNRDFTPAVSSFVVDTTVPVLTLLSYPPSFTNATSVSFTFSLDEPGTTECRLDGAGYVACTSPQVYSGLSDGLHLFEVRGFDRAGNVTGPVGYTFTVDTVPPPAPTLYTLTRLPAGLEVTFSTVPDAVSYEVHYGTSSGVYNGTDATQGPSPLLIPGTRFLLSGLFSDRAYYIAVRAVDSAGNRSPFSNELSGTPLFPSLTIGTILPLDFLSSTSPSWWTIYGDQIANGHNLRIRFQDSFGRVMDPAVTLEVRPPSLLKIYGFANLPPGPAVIWLEADTPTPFTGPSFSIYVRNPPLGQTFPVDITTINARRLIPFTGGSFFMLSSLLILTDSQPQYWGFRGIGFDDLSLSFPSDPGDYRDGDLGFDLNNDSCGPDLIVVGNGQNRIYPNDCYGGFGSPITAPLLPGLNDNSYGVLAFEPNGGGYTDLIVANHGDHSYVARFDPVSSSYIIGTPGVDFPETTGQTFYKPILVDFDENGVPELLLPNGTNPVSYWVKDRTGVFLNNPSGLFPANLTGYLRALYGDLDRDGTPEAVLIPDARLNPSAQIIKIGFSQGTFQVAPLTSRTGPFVDGALADLNGDLYPELILVGDGTENWILDLRTGQETPITPSGPWKTVALTDMDQDGQPDLIFGGTGLPVRVIETGYQGWEELTPVQGNPPPPLDGASLGVYRDLLDFSLKAVLFDGSSSTPGNSVYSLDLTTFQWQELCTSPSCIASKPPARARGGFAVTYNTLLMYGGAITDHRTYFLELTNPSATWQSLDLFWEENPPVADPLYSITLAKDTSGKLFFLAGGSAGTTYISYDGFFFTPNALIPSGGNVVGLAFREPDRFSAVDTLGYTSTSNDGVYWSGTAQYPYPFRGLAYSGTLFVAVGDAGQVVTSPDGSVYNTPSVTATTHSLYGVTASASRIVAVGKFGTVVTSTDGNIWYSSASLGTDLFSVAYGNNTYVAVGSGGAIYTSSDAQNWTARSSGVSSTLRAVHFAYGVFFAVGDNGTRLISEDNGLTWRVMDRGTITNPLYGLASGIGRKVVAVGGSGENANLLVPESATGSAMTVLLTYNNDQVVLFGGEEGGVLSNHLYLWDPWGARWNLLPHNDPFSPEITPRRDPAIASGRFPAMIYIFGGVVDPFSQAVTNDLWAYEIQSQSWIPIHSGQNCTVGVDCPQPRSHSAMILDSETNLWLLGGKDNLGTLYEDIWVYDLSHKRWFKVCGTNCGSTPRAQAFSGYDPDHRALLLFGGVDLTGLTNRLSRYFVNRNLLYPSLFPPQ